MNFGYFPPFPSSNPEFPPSQPMNSYMYPYQNYMNNSRGNVLGSIIDDHNARGGKVDNLIIQSQTPPQVEQHSEEEEVQFKQEEMS